MRTRLMWLFLLCCGLLLMMSLMVVVEQQPQAPLGQTREPAAPVALKPPRLPEPACQQAVQAKEDLSVPVCPFARQEFWREKAPMRPYRQAAYYAFYESDEAG